VLNDEYSSDSASVRTATFGGSTAGGGGAAQAPSAREIARAVPVRNDLVMPLIRSSS
jgi:hypothetical protein